MTSVDMVTTDWPGGDNVTGTICMAAVSAKDLSECGVHSTMTLVQACLLVITLLVACVGNTLVITVIGLTRDLHTLTSLFIVHLAVCDLLTAVVIMPMSAAVGFNDRKWDYGQEMCEVIGYFNIKFLIASILSLTLISVERCVAIIKPLHYANLMTPRRAGLLIGLLWLLSTLGATMPFMEGHYVFSSEKGLCSPDYPSQPVLTVVMLGGLVCLPLVFTLGMYCLIAKAALKVAKKGTIVCDEHHCTYIPSKKNEFKIVRLLFIITGLAFICWLPYIVVNIVSVLPTSQINPYVDAITSGLTLLASATNPWMYSLLNQSFRVGLKKQWDRLKAALQNKTPVRQIKRRRTTANKVSTIELA